MKFQTIHATISRKQEYRNSWTFLFFKEARNVSVSVNISVNDDKLSTFAYGKKLKSKAISIDLKKLVQTYLQSVFKSPVNIDNALA